MAATVTIGNASFQSAEPAMDNGFAGRVRNALAWRWGSQLLAQAITWTSTFMVVRLLDPSDYGLFAMSQVVIVALNFLNGYSFATSLIQADKIDDRRVGQVFAMLIVMNCILAISQFLMAPLAAAYFDQPQIANMLRIQAVLFLTTPFIALPSALLARRIEFRFQAFANLAGAVSAASTALLLAWLGFGVWALVYAPIAGFGFRAIGLTIAAKALVWPVFRLKGAGDIIGFGGALTLCQLFWIIQSQADIVIAGRSFSLHDMGIYNEALFLTLIVTGRFLPPINEVAYPAYAQLHKAGQSLGPYFLRTLRTVLLVVAPIYIGLALTARPAVLTLFGPKWEELIPIVAGLALAMPAMALQIMCSPATNAMGRARIYLTTSIAGAVIMPIAFLWGVSAGPMGLVHAWWVAAPMLLLFTLALTLPKVGLRPAKLLAELAPVVLACGVMAAVVLAVTPWASGLAIIGQLALLAAIGAVTYLGVLALGWPDMLRETWQMLRKREVSAEPVSTAVIPAAAVPALPSATPSGAAPAGRTTTIKGASGH